MKNIHVLPTDKPSKLFNCFGKLNIGDYITSREDLQVTNQNIYITSDEEIKEGINQWYLDKFINKPRNSSGSQYGEKQDVIIFTTDQDLIADGVQAIDDEFLEWFVKNPICEWVEVEKGYLGMCGFVKSSEPISKDKLHYKIIIPQEELSSSYLRTMLKQDFPQLGTKDFNDLASAFFGGKPKPIHQQIIDSVGGEDRFSEIVGSNSKQETLEEAAEKNYENKTAQIPVPTSHWVDSKRLQIQNFIEGAKWQSERMYSEEEVLQIVTNAFNQGERYGWDTQKSIENIDEMRNKIPFMSLEKYLEQFKKK
jgi:hypothetical protein